MTTIKEEQKYTIAWYINDKMISFDSKQKFMNLLIEKNYTTQTIMSENEFRRLWNEFERRFILI